MTNEQRAQIMRLLQMQLGARITGTPVKDDEPEDDAIEIPIDFQFVDKDDILEIELVKYLKNQNKKDAENSTFVASLMLIEGFGRKDFSQYLKNIYQGKIVKTGLCRKLLKSNKDVGYQCFDCQKDPTCIICAGCFEKSNHKGHRIFLKQHVGGMCDCGDKEAWDSKGNCSEHTGHIF